MKESKYFDPTEQRASIAWLEITTGLDWILMLGLLMQLLWSTIDPFYILR